METVSSFLYTVLAINELPLLNGQKCVRRGGLEACLDFTGTSISLQGVKYKFMRNTWDEFSVRSMCRIRDSVGKRISGVVGPKKNMIYRSNKARGFQKEVLDFATDSQTHLLGNPNWIFQL